MTETGVNLPGMFADYLLKGKPVDTKCSVKETGKRFVSEKILMEEYARGDANLAKVRRCMKEVDVYFIKDERDPRPYRYFRKYYPVVALMRIPYRVRDVLRKKLSLLN